MAKLSFLKLVVSRVQLCLYCWYYGMYAVHCTFTFFLTVPLSCFCQYELQFTPVVIIKCSVHMLMSLWIRLQNFVFLSLLNKKYLCGCHCEVDYNCIGAVMK